MSIELLAFIALAALVVIVFLMVYIRDVEVNKKLLMYEKSIEELNFQNHQLSKALKEVSHQEPFNASEFEKKVMHHVKQELHNSIIPMVSSLQDIESIMQTFQAEQTARIDRLESRTKEMSVLPTTASSSNEKIIVAQFAKGKSEAEIAKDLRVGIGEVDLVLKLANLK